MNISWCNSILVLKDSIRNTVFYFVTNWELDYFSKVRWIDMRSWRKIQAKANIFVLSFPKNIHNQNAAELDHYIMVFYRQESRTCFGDTGILVQHLFFRTFEAIASPLTLESSWQPRYSTVSCCLMEWLTKDILISFKPLVFEKRMDLVLSSPK